MDLDSVKAAWQKEKFDGYLFVTPLKQITSDIRRKAEQMDQKFIREQKRYITLASVGLLMLACLYDRQLPPLANIGLGIMVLCGAIALFSNYILKRRYRETRPELPRKEYLADQREKILARIRLVRRNMMWLLMPSFAGFLLWEIVQAHSKLEVLLLVNIAVIGCIAAIWLGWRHLTKELLPVLEEIDRELTAPDIT